MGILGLARLIGDICPEAIKEFEISSYFGRRIAIDASMSIYQFLIAVRSNSEMMSNSDGETTSHLVGLFYRTSKLLESGVKPVYVFDGAPPVLKSSELQKRKERRDEATKKLNEAETAEDVSKFSKRLVKVTKQHNDDCKKLLKLMGLPIINSPGEAEAQCAQLCKEGLVYAVATEDMDGLTFGSPRLIRNLSAGGSNEKCKEYTLSKVLDGLGINQNQFIDLGILMGCDYCQSIKGIGGKKGLDLIKKFGSIEDILTKKFNVSIKNEPEEDVKDESDNDSGVSSQDIKLKSEGDEVKKEVDETIDSLDDKQFINDEELDDNEDDDEEEIQKKTKTSKKGKKKASIEDSIPKNWLFRESRNLFIEPDVLKNSISEIDLKITDPDEEGLIEFLCTQNGFSEDRVKAAVKRIKAAKGKSNQTRIDTFFAAKPSNNNNNNNNDKLAKKRPATTTKKNQANKRGRKPK